MEENTNRKGVYIMNKFFEAVGQIAVGIVVGSAASKALDKVVGKAVETVAKAKKKGA